MKQLYKKEIDFNTTLEYVLDNLNNVNALSTELLNLLDFQSGYFFILLPRDANYKQIYQFKEGGILPQNPLEKYFNNGHLSTYSWIPDIDEELSELIFKEIESKPYFSCLIDKVTGTANDVYYVTFSDSNPLFYEEEVYFLLNKNNVSKSVVSKCLKASTSFWHSLSIFTTADLVNVTKAITLEKIKEVNLKTELIMIGAYDGEGYIFWEKNKRNEEEGFFSKSCSELYMH